MGVMVSILYNFGHCPLLIAVLIISATGIQRCGASSFIILAGISPGAVDLFTFICSRCCLTFS